MKYIGKVPARIAVYLALAEFSELDAGVLRRGDGSWIFYTEKATYTGEPATHVEIMLTPEGVPTSASLRGWTVSLPEVLLVLGINKL